MSDHERILETLQRYFGNYGMEVSMFNVEWYNNAVGKPFRLEQDPKTVAYVVLSAPSMFEKAFLPYIKKQKCGTHTHNQMDSTLAPWRDPLDQCLQQHFQAAKSLFDDKEIEIIQDFEILSNKRPKILVQTAAHVAGAAYYYQKHDVVTSHEKNCPLWSTAKITMESQSESSYTNSKNFKTGKSDTTENFHDMDLRHDKKRLNSSQLNSQRKSAKMLIESCTEPIFANGSSDFNVERTVFEENAHYTDSGCHGKRAEGEDEPPRNSHSNDVKLENDANDNKMNDQKGGTSNSLNAAVCTCPPPWDPAKRIYGVCVHPKYGGWFAIRGVMIFSNLQAKLLRHPPVDCCNTRSRRIEVLNRFNGNWQDWTYRDVIPVVERYSELQKEYFATLPKNRHLLIEKLFNDDSRKIMK